ncbi:hypothetical protein, partial [Candidatus Ichthyocystis hellenicum]|uniref:hypothetical protein n=1 Tax=Candidatus Ichthyocystis hellenicum TaxID=1561003 RepID=UPI0015844C1B
VISMLVVVTGSSKFTGTSYSFAEVVAGIEEELFQSIVEGLHVHVKVDFTRRRSTRMMGDLSKLSVKDITLSLRYDA